MEILRGGGYDSLAGGGYCRIGTSVPGQRETSLHKDFC